MPGAMGGTERERGVYRRASKIVNWFERGECFDTRKECKVGEV